MKKRIIIIEDEALIAAEIKSTLTMLGYEVVGHAMNGDKALDLFATVKADLILLDIHIRGSRSGIDLAKIINDKYRIPFIYLTSFSDKLTLNQVKETSPFAYIVKPFSEEDLSVNIELALHKYHTQQKEEMFSKEHVESKLKIKLTEREYEVLKAFKAGGSYQEVADELFISINTVKTYQKRLFQLLGVKSKYEMIAKFR